jgi:DNA-binding NtrC family response regulator
VNGGDVGSVILALEHRNLAPWLAELELDARVVLLDSLEEIEQYAGAKHTDLILLPDEVDDSQVARLRDLQEETSAHGQLLCVTPDGRARDLALLDPWRGADAPPPPPDDDLEEVVGTLLGFARVGELTGLVGSSPAIISVLRTVARVTPTDVPVLIRGPSGTGKELVARGIHRAGSRSLQPFIAVNTPGLSETLIESELFGHERGAFTGAATRKAGVFEAAGEGTIFLDEIGDLSRNLQSRLLRVLEQNEFQRVGGTDSIRVRARVLTATNVDLELAVAEGRFREDLYYRLKVVTIDLPPLQERPEDVVPLLHHFVAEICQRHNTDFLGFTDDAVTWLQRYAWPGNVRELRNLVEQLVLLYPDERITAERLTRMAEERSRDTRNLPAITGLTPEQAEREMIFKSLQAINDEIGLLRNGLNELAARSTQGTPDAWHVQGGAAASTAGPIDGDQALAGSIGIPLGTPLEEVELRLIEETLDRLGGDKRRTAEVLGIGLRTLYRRLARLDGLRGRTMEPNGDKES